MMELCQIVVKEGYFQIKAIWDRLITCRDISFETWSQYPVYLENYIYTYIQQILLYIPFIYVYLVISVFVFHLVADG